MSASIIQRKAAFATHTGSGSVAVTLDNQISVGSIIVIAAAVVQTDGSESAAPTISVLDDLGNGYSPTLYGSSGQSFFANAYQGAAIPQAGARTYTLSYTAQTGGSGYSYLAGICVYELSGVSMTPTNEIASQALSGFHKIADLSATISGLSGGTYGNLLVGIGAFLVTGLTDANAIGAGSGWTLDGRDAVNGTFDPMAIVFESQLVGTSSNPAEVFTGSANNSEIDGTILVAAYSLTSAIAGGGGGGGTNTSTTFLGSVTEVSDVPAGQADVFWGSVTVVSEAPAGRTNPYLGKVKIGPPPAGRTNPSLGQVVVVGSAPANDSDPYLSSVATS